MPTFDWQDLFAACALYLVLEGLLPAIAPGRFRETVRALSGLDDRALRIMGIGSMIAGAVLLSFVRG